MTMHPDASRKAMVAVTGARGFLGSALAAALSQEGCSVIRLSRQDPGSKTYFSLHEPVSPSLLDGVSVLIHAAYDFSLTRPHDIRQVNVEGTRRLFNAAIAANVKKIIFVSSVSAFADSRQLYGRAKHAAERIARGIGAYVVRPGIIYDDGLRSGLLSKLAFFARLPLIPLFDGGRQPVLLTHLHDITALLIALIRSAGRAPRAPITAALPAPISFRSLLAELARRQKKAPHFMPVPSWPISLMLRAMERLGFRPPFRSDSLIGLLEPNPAHDFSLTASYGTSWRPFETGAAQASHQRQNMRSDQRHLR